MISRLVPLEFVVFAFPMDMLLVKIFATALALSEVTTQPQAVKTHFDPEQDRAQVVQILRHGCAHMRQAFDIESINLDDLISTALNDPKAVGADIKRSVPTSRHFTGSISPT